MSTVLTTRALTLAALSAAVGQAWMRATSADPLGWRPDNNAWGQCAVTALVVQDYLGGQLRRGEVGEISHYWNVLPSGEEVDLTRHQFAEELEISNVQERTRKYLLSHSDTARRYAELKRAVETRLQLRA